MSVLKAHRTESKAEFINVADKIYVETVNFLSRLSARYSRIFVPNVSALASEVLDNSEKANSIFPSGRENIKTEWRIRVQYIVHKRLKDNCIGGNIHIPALSICEENNGLIMYDGLPVCYTTSENAHQFIARDDDNMGLERGKLTQSIQNTLAKRDDEYQNRWNKIWKDSKCRKYKRVEYDDYWLWNHDFFNADIETLRYIAKLVGVKGVV